MGDNRVTIGWSRDVSYEMRFEIDHMLANLSHHFCELSRDKFWQINNIIGVSQTLVMRVDRLNASNGRVTQTSDAPESSLKIN